MTYEPALPDAEGGPIRVTIRIDGGNATATLSTFSFTESVRISDDAALTLLEAMDAIEPLEPFAEVERPYDILDGATLYGEFRSESCAARTAESGSSRELCERCTFEAHNPDPIYATRQHAFCTAVLDAAASGLHARQSVFCLETIRGAIAVWSARI